MFSGSAVAGAKVLHIVSVYSVSNGGELQLRRQLFHLCKKFGLAVITAIGVVGYVIWVFEFGRNNKLVTKARLSNEGLGLLAIMLRKTRRQSGHCQSALGQRGMGRPGQISRIRAARERHEQGIQLAEAIEE